MGEPEISHVHDFRIWGRVHDSQNQLFFFGNNKTLQMNQEKSKIFVKNPIYFWKSQTFGNPKF